MPGAGLPHLLLASVLFGPLDTPLQCSTAPVRASIGGITSKIKQSGKKPAPRKRRRADGELRRSEAYLAEGQRLTRTGSWAFDVASGRSFWSAEFFRIFELDPAT